MALLCTVTAYAQDVFDTPGSQITAYGAPKPGLKYAELRRHYYDPHNYSLPYCFETHSPTLAGAASILIPGLGECINGEWGRGLGKFAGSLAMLAVVAVSEPSRFDYDGNGYLKFLGICGYWGIRLWSVIDAVNITKVLNMYEYDLGLLGVSDLSVYPAIGAGYNGRDSFATFGVGIAVSF